MLIDTFEAPLLAKYADRLLPGHRRALTAMKQCRTVLSPRMQALCNDCDAQVFVPHSGNGDKALVYLGRYLYRGVLQEKDILGCEQGQVTFRYQNSQTHKRETRTLAGADFLWLLLAHVLPKGFRRTRNFGFLHPNSKRLIQLLRDLFKLAPELSLGWFKKRPPLRCPCCGGDMRIVQTRIRSPVLRLPLPDGLTQALAV